MRPTGHPQAPAAAVAEPLALDSRPRVPLLHLDLARSVVVHHISLTAQNGGGGGGGDGTPPRQSQNPIHQNTLLLLTSPHRMSVAHGAC